MNPLPTLSLLISLSLLPTAHADFSTDLVGYWPFDGDLLDSSPTGGHGTLQGTTPTPSFVAGQFGQSIDLDGTDQRVEITAVPEDAYDFPGSDLTISLWCSTPGFDKGFNTVIGKGEGGGPRIARSSNSSNMYYAGGSGTSDIIGSTDIQDGQMHHLVATTENGVITELWIDGVKEADSGTDTPNIENRGNPLMIGGNPDVAAPYRCWIGAIDDVAIWTRKLNDTEIGQIWNSGTGAAISSLLITDTDGDGLDDGWEDTHFGNGDGTPTMIELALQNGSGDPDGDLLDNLGEFTNGSDPNDTDTDDDNLTDNEEVNTTGTNPALADSDMDGVQDDVEVATAGYNPLNPDSDGDGLNDGVEDTNGNGTQDGSETDVTNADTDGDNWNDGFEVANSGFGFDPLVNDGTEDPDNDNLDNNAEFANGTNPVAADTDNDGVQDDVEVATSGYDPLNSDSDGDSLLDGTEDANGNGVLDPGETDPTDADTDGDGFDDGIEIAAGTDPNDDTDFPVAPPGPTLDTAGYFALFNGTDLTNWYTFLEDGIGVNSDPDNIFKVENNMIHLLDLGDILDDVPFGYFATTDDYRNYRLRFEYLWGTDKYTPRKNSVRDSGLLYHQIGNDTVWPSCVECQVQENDTGDFFMLGGTTLNTTVTGGNTYQAAGTPLLNSGSRIVRNPVADNLTGWNVVEAIVTEAEGIHVVNGIVNNRGTNYMHGGSLLTEGKIGLQVEGAEIFYRNIEVKPLFTTGGGPAYKVLVFSKTSGFRHGSIASGIAAIQEIGTNNNFTVDATEDATQFNAANLAQYACVIFLNTTGDVLNATQEAAFEQYIQAGGGYAGVHSATDTEYSWAWYGNLVGSYFNGHPAIQNADLCVCDDCHPSTESLGTEWMRRDEWYNFNPDPTLNPNITILVTIDETSYSGGTMGASHPITWCQEYDGGRSWYTAMGHTNETYDEPQFRMHLLGGIEWAAGQSRKPTSDKTILFDGTDTSSWEKLSDGSPIDWPIIADALEVNNGNIVTSTDYQDFRLHLEFRPNSTNAAAEQDRGNSGVYLQGRYEIQVLDSYNHPLDGQNDCGAIYNVKNADSQEAWPADAWQHYDIWFRAPRWNGSTKTENARVTVFWNGKRIHDGVEIPGTTTAGLPEGPTDGPIMLQDHSNAVRFRNIWIEPNTTLPAPLSPTIQVTDISFDPLADEFTLTWNANFPGPYNIVAGDATDLQALSAPPNHLLPIPAALGVTSPATFPVPATLSGQPKVFVQVTD